MRGNGQPRRTQGRRITVRQELGRLKSALHGHANKLSHLAPPAVNYRPYNSLVVSHVVETPGVEQFIGPVDVINYIKNQLGLQDQTKTLIVFKLRRIDFYAVPIGSSGDRPAVNMIVSALTPVLGDPATPGVAAVSYGNLYSANDVGSLQDCAKLSYSFPQHMADVPLSQVSAFTFLACVSNVPNAELRFHVEWSTVAEATPVA